MGSFIGIVETVELELDESDGRARSVRRSEEVSMLSPVLPTTPKHYGHILLHRIGVHI